MHRVPDCLNRRNQALDRLIKELCAPRSSNGQCSNDCGDKVAARLMHDFWDTLNDDPMSNLASIQNRASVTSKSSCSYPQRVACYMAGRKQDDGSDGRREALNKVKTFCKNNPDPKHSPQCCTSQSPALSEKDILPLTKVLCNLKEAASFDKQCDAKITDLMNAQRELRDQIQNLEKRENAGIQMLKQADCMWTCMEDSYKKKVAESLERQKTLFQELKEVEASAGKWRKNKNDLEFQMKNIEKCEKEIKEKINQKSNDMKGINAEVDDFQKRVDKNKKEIEAANKSLTTKRQASDLKMTNLAADITFNQKKISEENKYKENKEKEGSGFVKDAREDLQKLCKVLLQKKIENEDLRAEKAALNLELDLLNKSHDACQNKCGQKQQSVLDEIKSIDKDISEFKVKCIRCHECTDTGDVRKYCTDCPRCLNERDCIYEDGVCKLDETMDCVCMNVKEKFLDNIFDNMCTVLERQGKTEQGRAVADAILKCLKKSRNGKLDASTRKLLQDFVLSTVKQHLNLTIIGGAVKTRCEMDPETYKQLMLCLKQVKVVGPTKEDKETDAKKETCRRWGGDCNCPKSGKGCVCDKIAPPMQPESAAGPKETSNPKEASNNDTCKVTFCPPKTSTCCGTDIMAQGVSSRVATEVSAFKQEPCRDSSCGYPKNMRAAQCVLGPEILNSPTRSSKPSMPSLPETPVLEGKFCKCSTPSIKSCSCRDLEQHPREKIIEEVMGRYIEVPVIDKVTAINETQLGEIRDSGNSVDQAIPRSVTSTNGQSSKFVSSEESDKIDEVQLESKQNVVKLIPKDAKKLKVVINDGCNKENCDVLWEKAMTVKPRDNDNLKMLNKDTSKVEPPPTKEVKTKDQESDQRHLNIMEHIINLTNSKSGTLMTELDEKIIDLLERGINENKFAYVKSISPESLVVEFDKQEQNRSKISIRKTQSGSKYLEIRKDKNKTKSELNVKQVNDTDKLSHSKSLSPERLRKIEKSSTCNFTKRGSNSCKDKCTEIIKRNLITKSTKTDEGEAIKLSKLKIQISDKIIEAPAFLKLTDSQNFEIVIDNEHEKWFVQQLNQFIGNAAYKFTLNKTDSDSYFIHLINLDEKRADDSRYSLKSSSTCFKIVSNSIENYNKTIKETEMKFNKPLHIRSSSDTKIYKKDTNILDTETLVQSFETLKKTSSGKIIVVLDKNKKMNLINNLKSYLVDCKGFVPVVKTDTGDIIIDFSGNKSTASKGSLKITSSGNIYAVVDETFLRNNNRNQFDSSNSTYNNIRRSEHLIDENKHPTNKAMATTCNGNPDTTCDVMKCVCKKLQCLVKNIEKDSDEKKVFLSVNSELDWTNFKSNSFAKQNKIDNQNTLKDYPHIVIKSNIQGPTLKSNEDPYNAVENICPLHKDRYEGVSNELLKISGPCNVQENIAKEVKDIFNFDATKSVYDNYWDSLTFLPPQLPEFLRDVEYK